MRSKYRSTIEWELQSVRMPVVELAEQFNERGQWLPYGDSKNGDGERGCVRTISTDSSQEQRRSSVEQGDANASLHKERLMTTLCCNSTDGPRRIWRQYSEIGIQLAAISVKSSMKVSFYVYSKCRPMS
jgi:hypothetical protein